MTQLQASHSRGWSVQRMHDGTDYFLAQLKRVEADLTAPSSLPGWRRAEVVAHVARNADALRRLLRWAETDIESPMYSGPTQREDEIRQSAAQPVGLLLADARRSADLLGAAVAELADEAWAREVRTARGRIVAAAEIPWMRVREVWVHGVDLQSDGAMADLPGDIVDALLDDVATTFTSRGESFDVTLAPDDRDRIWRVGTAPEPPIVTGATASVLAWLIGRPPPSRVEFRPELVPPTWP